MGRDILALDVGTSGLKAGVYTSELEPRAAVSRQYEPDIGADGHADVDPGRWWSAIVDACTELADALRSVGVVALSVTTPGLTPMAADGRALGPAILFLDGRSRSQAAAIRASVGEERFLE